MRRSLLALTLLAACGSDRDRSNSVRTPNNCGNDEIDSGEVCDSTNLGPASCVSLGLGVGTLSCASNCKSLDKSRCGAPATCGNGALDPAELCDGANLGTASCTTVGLGSETLACLANCNGYNTAGCVPVTSPVCGNGRVEGTEVCDGADLGGTTCAALGFTGGNLACASDCRARVTTGCTGTCTPACGTRVCGPDPTCGASCGTCASGTCNASGICEGGPGGAPVIISFTTNVTTHRTGDLIFSAIVTDPDGVDDLIGGQLVAPGGGTYGAFATSAQEGAYSLILTRQALHQVDPLNGPNTGVSRTFRAQFFDSAGHNVASEVTITVRCPADGESLCNGSCFDLANDESNCGQCGRACEPLFPPQHDRDYDANDLALPWCQASQCIYRTFAKGPTVATTCQARCASDGAGCAAPAGNPAIVGEAYYYCETTNTEPVLSCGASIPTSLGIDCPLDGLMCRCQI